MDDTMYLGRLQQGEELPLVLQCRDAAESPADPAADPVATLYRDDAGTLAFVESVKLAACERGTAVGLFRLPLFLGNLYSTTGRYIVIFRWQIGGSGFSRAAVFQLLPGGNQDGSIIAMSFVARPDANHLISQTDAGRLVRGRNPR